MIDLIIIFVALCAAPYMLAKMLKLPAPPSPRMIFSVIGPVFLGGLGLLGYLLKRAFAYQWQPEPHEVHHWVRGGEVSSVSITSSGESGTDTRTDGRTDPVSALHEAAEELQLDRSRKSIIYILVLAGWDVGAVRAVLKGANDAIGVEVAEVRKQLGIDAPIRMIAVRDQSGEREIAI